MFVAIFLLMLIGSGFIAERIFSVLSRCKDVKSISTGMSFSLLIFITNTIGMYLLKDVSSLSKLIANFNLVVFTTKYALLSIFVGMVLAVIGGIAARVLHSKKSHPHSENC